MRFNDLTVLLAVAATTFLGLALMAGLAVVRLHEAQPAGGDVFRYGTAQEITRAITDGQEVNAKYEDGRTALMIAIESQRGLETIGALLEASADVNAKDVGGRTPLMLAAAYSDAKPRVVRALLEAGADVRAKAKNGDTSLNYAARQSNSPEVVGLLIGAGGVVDGKNVFGVTPLMSAAKFNTRPAIAQAIIEAGADLNAINQVGDTALVIAHKEHNVEVEAVIVKALGSGNHG